MGKAQIWGNTRGWGKPKRIVLDGSPGGGKTTLLSGTSQRDIYNREFKGINKSNSCLEGIDYIALTSETAASQHPFKVLDFIQHILNYIKGID